MNSCSRYERCGRNNDTDNYYYFSHLIPKHHKIVDDFIKSCSKQRSYFVGIERRCKCIVWASTPKEKILSSFCLIEVLIDKNHGGNFISCQFMIDQYFKVLKLSTNITYNRIPYAIEKLYEKFKSENPQRFFSTLSRLYNVRHVCEILRKDMVIQKISPGFQSPIYSFPKPESSKDDMELAKEFFNMQKISATCAEDQTRFRDLKANAIMMIEIAQKREINPELVNQMKMPQNANETSKIFEDLLENEGIPKNNEEDIDDPLLTAQDLKGIIEEEENQKTISKLFEQGYVIKTLEDGKFMKIPFDEDGNPILSRATGVSEEEEIKLKDLGGDLNDLTGFQFGIDASQNLIKIPTDTEGKALFSNKVTSHRVSKASSLYTLFEDKEDIALKASSHSHSNESKVGEIELTARRSLDRLKMVNEAMPNVEIYISDIRRSIIKNDKSDINAGEKRLSVLLERVDVMPALGSGVSLEKKLLEEIKKATEISTSPEFGQTTENQTSLVENDNFEIIKSNLSSERLNEIIEDLKITRTTQESEIGLTQQRKVSKDESLGIISSPRHSSLFSNIKSGERTSLNEIFRKESKDYLFKKISHENPSPRIMSFDCNQEDEAMVKIIENLRISKTGSGSDTTLQPKRKSSSGSMKNDEQTQRRLSGSSDRKSIENIVINTDVKRGSKELIQSKSSDQKSEKDIEITTNIKRISKGFIQQQLVERKSADNIEVNTNIQRPSITSDQSQSSGKRSDLAPEINTNIKRISKGPSLDLIPEEHIIEKNISITSLRDEKTKENDIIETKLPSSRKVSSRSSMKSDKMKQHTLPCEERKSSEYIEMSEIIKDVGERISKESDQLRNISQTRSPRQSKKSDKELPNDTLDPKLKRNLQIDASISNKTNGQVHEEEIPEIIREESLVKLGSEDLRNQIDISSFDNLPTINVKLESGNENDQRENTGSDSLRFEICDLSDSSSDLRSKQNSVEALCNFTTEQDDSTVNDFIQAKRPSEIVNRLSLVNKSSENALHEIIQIISEELNDKDGSLIQKVFSLRESGASLDEIIEEIKRFSIEDTGNEIEKLDVDDGHLSAGNIVEIDKTLSKELHQKPSSGFSDKMEKLNELQRLKSDEVVRLKSNEMMKSKSDDASRLKSYDTDKSKSEEITKLRSDKITKTKSDEVAKTKSEIVRMKSNEMTRSKSDQFEKLKSVEERKQKSDEIERKQSNEVIQMRSTERSNLKSEISKVKLQDFLKKKSSDTKNGVNIDDGALPILQSTPSNSSTFVEKILDGILNKIIHENLVRFIEASSGISYLEISSDLTPVKKSTAPSNSIGLKDSTIFGKTVPSNAQTPQKTQKTVPQKEVTAPPIRNPSRRSHPASVVSNSKINDYFFSRRSDVFPYAEIDEPMKVKKTGKQHIAEILNDTYISSPEKSAESWLIYDTRPKDMPFFNSKNNFGKYFYPDSYKFPKPPMDLIYTTPFHEIVNNNTSHAFICNAKERQGDYNEYKSYDEKELDQHNKSCSNKFCHTHLVFDFNQMKDEKNIRFNFYQSFDSDKTKSSKRNSFKPNESQPLHAVEVSLEETYKGNKSHSTKTLKTQKNMSSDETSTKFFAMERNTDLENESIKCKLASETDDVVVLSVDYTLDKLKPQCSSFHPEDKKSNTSSDKDSNVVQVMTGIDEVDNNANILTTDDAKYFIIQKEFSEKNSSVFMENKMDITMNETTCLETTERESAEMTEVVTSELKEPENNIDITVSLSNPLENVKELFHPSATYTNSEMSGSMIQSCSTTQSTDDRLMNELYTPIKNQELELNCKYLGLELNEAIDISNSVDSKYDYQHKFKTETSSENDVKMSPINTEWDVRFEKALKEMMIKNDISPF